MTRFTILDTETTGLNPQWGDNIIEVALLQAEYDNGQWKEIARYDTLVKPDMEVTERVTYITGIRPEDLEDAPRFAAVKEKVESYLTDSIIVGHNIEFDLSFLQGSGIETKHLARLDTMDLAGLFEEEGKSLSLQSLAMRNGVEHDAHRAMGDVLATYEMLQKYAREIRELSPALLTVLSHATSQVQWPAKAFFPSVSEDEKAIDTFFTPSVSPSIPDDKAPTDSPLPELTNLLDGQRPSVLHMRAPLLHDAEIFEACRSWSVAHGKPIRLVLTDFSDVILSRMRDDPSLRSVSPEYVVDRNRLQEFLSSPQWEKDKFLFAVRLLRWLSSSATGNTRELSQKHPERRYLYAVLPTEVTATTVVPSRSPIRICSLREFLDLPSDDLPTVVVDATFLDEDLIRARTETLTMRRTMGILQAAEETLVTSSEPFPDPELKSCQEKTAFFFAHLANALSHFEEKETRLTDGMRSDRKIAESILLSQTLEKGIMSILERNGPKLCAALKKEMRAIATILSAYSQPSPLDRVILSTRGRDEGCLQVWHEGSTTVSDVMRSAIMVASPSRENNPVTKGLSGISTVGTWKEGTLVTKAAQDIRPDASTAYVTQLSDWMRGRLSRNQKGTIFIFGNGKLLEQVVMGLEPFLKEKAVSYCAERLQGGATKVREWYERNPDNILFCTTDFFLSLDPTKVTADSFILQKLPFGVERTIIPGIRPEAVFMSVTLPKGLYRFERVLEQIRLIPTSDKELIVLDNKLLTDKGYGESFREMLPAGWSSAPLAEIV